LQGRPSFLARISPAAVENRFPVLDNSTPNFLAPANININWMTKTFRTMQGLSPTPQKCNNRHLCTGFRDLVGKDFQKMNRIWISTALGVILVAGIAAYSYRRWGTTGPTPRASLLLALPSESGTVLFIDLADLRPSPFFAEFSKWLPQQKLDSEYLQFEHDTGFDYERDLDRVAIALIHRGQQTTFFAVADGKFDREKIESYIGPKGRTKTGGRDVFAVTNNAGTQAIWLSFLTTRRIAVTDDPRLNAFVSDRFDSEETRQWQARFDRLAGSPAFAVFRQDAKSGTLLASNGLAGLQSPQLSALLDQLQWVTVAGKPENDQLRVVAEGECISDSIARQLTEILNGILILSQAGLNAPQARESLQPKSRDAYLEMLRGTDVSRIDRGETKSVRLVFDVTPRFLKAVREATSAVSNAPSAPITDVPTKPAAIEKRSGTKRKSRKSG
jgi:hypothetical protein